MGVIGFFAKRRMDDQDTRLGKHEEWMIAMQKNLNAVAHKTDKAIDLIHINQENDRKRLELFEKVVLKLAS